MTWNPTYKNLQDGEQVLSDHYNALVRDIQNLSQNLDGSALSKPLHLRGDLDGSGKEIYNFRKWFGTGINSIRDVTGYGALGDGSADDADAIQAAIDDLPSTGGVLFFPPGTYKISKTVLMAGTSQTRSNITLQGCGSSSVIYLMDSSNCRMLAMGVSGATVSGMRISAIKFDGNGGGQTVAAAAVDMRGTENASVMNCLIRDTKGVGLELADAKDAIVDSLVVWGGTTHSIASSSPGGSNQMVIKPLCFMPGACGIYLGPPAVGTTILGGFIVQSGTNGIYIKGDQGQLADTVQIVDILIDTPGSNGIALESGGSGSDVRSVICSGVQVVHAGNNGIILSTSGGGTISAFSIGSGNVLTQCTGSGIAVKANTTNGTVFGNICQANQSFAGIYVDGETSTTKASGIAITGNSCYENQGQGINLSANTERITCVGNTVYGNTTSPISDSGTDNDVSHNAGF